MNYKLFNHRLQQNLKHIYLMLEITRRHQVHQTNATSHQLAKLILTISVLLLMLAKDFSKLMDQPNGLMLLELIQFILIKDIVWYHTYNSKKLFSEMLDCHSFLIVEVLIN